MASQNGYERQGSRSTTKSWSLRFFLLAINIFLIFLIIDIAFLRNASIVFMSLSIVVLTFNYIRNRMTEEQVIDDNPQDLFPLLTKYFRINRKYLLASILGLSLAILVLSQVILLTNSGSGNIYANALNNGQTPVFSAHIEGFDFQNSNNFTSIMDDAKEKFEEVASDQDMVVKDLYSSFKYHFFLNLNITDGENEEDYYQDRIYLESDAIPKSTFDILEGFPTFPKNLNYSQGFTLMTMFSYEFERNRDHFNNLSELTFSSDSENSNNFTLDLNGLWVIQDEDEQYASANNYYQILNDLYLSVVTPTGMETEVFGDKIPRYSRNSMFGFIDIDSLRGRSTSDVVQGIRAINNAMYSFLQNNGLNVWIESEAEWRIENAQFEEAGIRFIMLLVSLPMIGISLYLVYFSLNLVELRKQNLVSIMKIRGMSSGQLKFIMTIESIIAALISGAIGMAVSVPWTDYIIQSTQLYGEESNVYISSSWFWMIPIIAIILAIDLNIGSILSISTTSVEEGDESEETKEPFWRRLYLDVILTVVGVGTWLVIRYIPFPPGIMEFVLLLGIWTLPALVLGIPLFVSRYYSDFLTIISDFLWKQEGGLIALATRNMRRNKFSASKLAVLLMIGMMFSFVAIGVPHSFSEWSGESVYYDTGADFQIQNIDPSNGTHLEVLENQTEISSYSIFHRRTVSFYNNQFGQAQIIGINATNFAASAYWKSSYADSSLNVLLKILEEGKTLVQEDAMDVLRVETGDNIVVSIGEVGSAINEEIGGSFKYWPNLLDYLYHSEDYISNLAMVLPIDIYQSYFNETSANVYAKITNGANHTLVNEQLEQGFEEINTATTVVIESAAITQGLFLEETGVVLLFSMLDTLLIVTLLTSIIGVGYFSFTTLQERKREIGVFRAVGMVSGQIFTLLVVESVVLVSSSIAIGIVAGSFISENLFLLLGGQFGSGTIPPIDLIYPPLLTIGFVAGTLLLSVIAAAIPARSTATKQTGSILRAE